MGCSRKFSDIIGCYRMSWDVDGYSRMFQLRDVMRCYWMIWNMVEYFKYGISSGGYSKSFKYGRDNRFIYLKFIKRFLILKTMNYV